MTWNKEEVDVCNFWSYAGYGFASLTPDYLFIIALLLLLSTLSLKNTAVRSCSCCKMIIYIKDAKAILCLYLIDSFENIFISK